MNNNLEDNKQTKICKFYVKGNCSKGNNCEFIHQNNICREYFFEGNCKRNNKCKFIHDFTLNNNNYNKSNLNKSNLNNSNLNNSNLNNSNLNNSNLNNSNLNNSNLNDSNLNDSNLNDSNLNDSNLNDSNLNNSKLNDSKLNDSKLNDSKLNKSNLNDSNLNDSNLNKSNLNKSNLNKNKHKRNKPKNTTDFTPDHKPLDMKILVNKSLNKYNDNDVVIVPNFIKETYEGELYKKLLDEMENTGINKDKLWMEWHGNNHLIADDSLDWKKNTPTFNYIVNELEKYFNMKIRSTRFNLYKNSDDWKPYHHDAAAIKEHISKIQNFTVGISLGAVREIAFQHAKTNTTITIPLDNCTAYAFSKRINIEWKHGIPQIEPNKRFTEGRISIIAWGEVVLNE